MQFLGDGMLALLGQKMILPLRYGIGLRCRPAVVGETTQVAHRLEDLARTRECRFW